MRWSIGSLKRIKRKRKGRGHDPEADCSCMWDSPLTRLVAPSSGTPSSDHGPPLHRLNGRVPWTAVVITSTPGFRSSRPVPRAAAAASPVAPPRATGVLLLRRTALCKTVGPLTLLPRTASSARTSESSLPTTWEAMRAVYYRKLTLKGEEGQPRYMFDFHTHA